MQAGIELAIIAPLSFESVCRCRCRCRWGCWLICFNLLLVQFLLPAIVPDNGGTAGDDDDNRLLLLLLLPPPPPTFFAAEPLLWWWLPITGVVEKLPQCKHRTCCSGCLLYWPQLVSTEGEELTLIPSAMRAPSAETLIPS